MESGGSACPRMTPSAASARRPNLGSERCQPGLYPLEPFEYRHLDDRAGRRPEVVLYEELTRNAADLGDSPQLKRTDEPGTGLYPFHGLRSDTERCREL